MSNAELLVSVIITTYNRADALRETLVHLASQTLAPDRYEIVVADDGSTDATSAMLDGIELPVHLIALRQPSNQGISAGRNRAIDKASGTYLVLVSDDLLVPPDFLERHVETLRRFPSYWVVGGLEQLPATTESPFGRYLERMERSFDEARRAREVVPGVWEMTWPTARNLSLPREEFLKAGPFDEQFRSACEDQDLAHRARDLGIGFLYDTRISCLHNDQVASLARCCRQQRAFGHDGVLYCAKRPEIHGEFEVIRANRRIAPDDRWPLKIKKLAKGALARDPVIDCAPAAISAIERMRLPDPVLFRMYKAVISLSIFRGVREGLETLRQTGRGELADSLGNHSGS